MEIMTEYGPSATIAKVYLAGGESLTAESGAMMAISGPVQVTTSTYQRSGGGFFKGLKRMLSGESFFLNHFMAQDQAQIWLTTPLPGDLLTFNLQGERLILAGGSFVACEPSVSIDMQWQGLKGLFTGENLFWVQAQGRGKILAGSFGFIYEVDVDGEYIVDTGHIVAFEETLNYTISKASKDWLSAFLSGEGFICRFQGRGKIWCQSHNPGSFGKRLSSMLRPKQR
jgi:uncharacterized protein (TIGR00266 family)